MRTAAMVAASALLALGAIGPTAQPAAASTCTGWKDKVNPPSTIRVLRDGRTVETVNFRRYVEIVMAAEWPAFYPQATLEAAAVAVKQFGWYYTMNHRSWYRTSGGACYDVKDNTSDQIYWPDTRTPKAEHLAAVRDTWGLSVRKRDRFFLTGYRAGAFVDCGKDADGFRLYAHSAFKCGRAGMTRAQIQHVYYDPGLTFVWADGSGDTTGGGDSGDTTAPTVTVPAASVRQSATLGNGSSVVSWSGSDADSGIARYQLQRSIDGGPYRAVDLPSSKATSVSQALLLGRTYRFRVQAIDGAGNRSAWRAGPAFRPVLHQDGSSSVRYGKSWRVANTSSASGGSTRHATASGSMATLTFTGRTVAFVAPRGPGRGTARIYLDDVLVRTIDLSAPSERPRRIMFVKSWPGRASHTIRVEVTGTGRVDVDAFLVYQ
ncbi:MAG: SpoIID/LytB domain-containing protein [Chloroflexi bacterium]|nr:SpoIID/LytB domain-containing protein [Chloroflexota bacterium]